MPDTCTYRYAFRATLTPATSSPSGCVRACVGKFVANNCQAPRNCIAGAERSAPGFWVFRQTENTGDVSYVAVRVHVCVCSFCYVSTLSVQPCQTLVHARQRIHKCVVYEITQRIYHSAARTLAVTVAASHSLTLARAGGHTSPASTRSHVCNKLLRPRTGTGAKRNGFPFYSSAGAERNSFIIMELFGHAVAAVADSAESAAHDADVSVCARPFVRARVRFCVSVRACVRNGAGHNTAPSHRIQHN